MEEGYGENKEDEGQQNRSRGWAGHETICMDRDKTMK